MLALALLTITVDILICLIKISKCIKLFGWKWTPPLFVDCVYIYVFCVCICVFGGGQEEHRRKFVNKAVFTNIKMRHYID